MATASTTTSLEEIWVLFQKIFYFLFTWPLLENPRIDDFK
jgi:hypothetical protein